MGYWVGLGGRVLRCWSSEVIGITGRMIGRASFNANATATRQQSQQFGSIFDLGLILKFEHFKFSIQVSYFI